MKTSIEYYLNRATESEILEHLLSCDADFVPPLSGRVSLNDYARKISSKAMRFEAWSGNTLVGLVAAYCNDPMKHVAYITNVSVLKERTGEGIAFSLLQQCIARATELEMKEISLEVASDNVAAIKLYEKAGFILGEINPPFVNMLLYPIFESTSLSICNKRRNVMNTRDYNNEIKDTVDHKYAYNFDFEVMHPYMIRSFAPFFNKGSLLELGSFKGDFTRRVLPYFEEITCVEASELAMIEAKQKLSKHKIQFVNSIFENAILPKRYDNIVLTHVLEHLDDPVRVLKRVNDEWLAEAGRFFLVCPNANAPSRQIAVKMGLITHNAAVTPAEAEHGHLRTYTLDTLERDAVSAGLKVVYRSGIFFKALANFQWDRLLQTDIISKEYLDGCYMLGQQYPDLCSSIFLMCERGKKL